MFNILASWGPGGADLDLHLAGPQGGSTFQVYYANRGSLTAQPFALLHADDTGTSGSEVITVQQFNQGGPYQASVFNFGNSSTTSTNLSTTAGLSLSVINGGTVVPTSGGGSTVQGGSLVASLTPTPNLAGNTWIAVSIDPATGQVTLVNQITNSNNGIITPAPAALSTAAVSTAAAPAVASTEPVATVAAPAVVSTAPAATVAAPAALSTAPVSTVAAPAVASSAPVAAVAAPAVITTAQVSAQGAPSAVPAVLSTAPVSAGPSTRPGHRHHQ